MSNEVKGEVISWGKTILFAILLAWLINNVVIVNAKVPTGSMENTIMTNDRIVALRLSYVLDSPQRGDIAVFRYPDDPEKLYVKRVIGMPGDTVQVIDGKVFLNDDTEPLEEPYTKEPPVGDFGPYVVPEDCYFMMGDNRNNSQDSRYWKNKYVEKGEILGKVIFRYYPGFKMLNH